MRTLLSSAGFAVLVAVAPARSITVTGSVTDQQDRPVADALVSLLNQGLWGYTDSTGSFELQTPGSVAARPATARSSLPRFSVNRGVLRLMLEREQRVEASVFGLTGRREQHVVSKALPAGSHRISLRQSRGSAASVRVLRVSIAGETLVVRLTPGGRGPVAATAVRPALGKRGNAADTLVVSKAGFVTERREVTATTQDFPDIVLQGDGIEARVDSVLALMTPAGKYGQMVQAEVHDVVGTSDVTEYRLGSVLSGGGMKTSRVPGEWADIADGLQAQALATPRKIPLIYGVDAVHGHGMCRNATVFPHNIGMACTRNPELMRRAGAITALEVLGTGTNYTFAPCVAVPRDERWGRTYEGLGEVGADAAVMAEAAVLGLQGQDLSLPTSILSCPKHYVADGGTVYGTGPESKSAPIDRGDATCDEATLRAVHLPPYEAAVKAGAATIMLSYSSWQGTHLHVHDYLINDVLKGELGFDGVVITDYDGITTASEIEAENGNLHRTLVKYAVTAGVDMFMSPGVHRDVPSELAWLVNNGEVSQERIDDAVRRILRIKFRLGLFDRDSHSVDRSLTARIGAQGHRDVARECVRQSLVLLKNHNRVLPLPKSGAKIAVLGRHANDLNLQCGGWTMGWAQFAEGLTTEGTTILEGLREVAADPGSVVDVAGGSVPGDADAVVVVTGEKSYAEWFGDVGWDIGWVSDPILDLELPDESKQLIDKAHAAGKPVVLVLISGRPLIFGEYLNKCDAVVAAWLPGTEGAGVADVLFGDYNPTGKLSHSWPSSESQIPINHGDGKTPQWEYGWGLGYE